ncbi:MAG: LacI family DNA-binding transcriptional regulator [Ferruginibacter sp.]
MEQPTIRDIAIELGISISTVSRALRNQPDVNKETRKAVMELAEKLDYHPNRASLSLLKKHTNTIGVLVPNLDFFFSTAIKGIDEAALEGGYTVMVCQSNEAYGKELINLKRLLESGVDGFIISVSSDTKLIEHFKKIQDKGIPMIFFDRDINGLQLPKILLNNFEGGYIATKHLIDQGYSRIAYLGGPEKMSISHQRFEGYKAALKEFGIKLSAKLIEHGDFSRDYAYVATEEMLKAKQVPDAIFAMSDRLAIGAMMAIKKAGLSMPKDIGLIGFNNEPITELLSPSISTVDQPAFEMGKAAARIFIEMINNSEVIPENIILKPKLVVRQSTGRR